MDLVDSCKDKLSSLRIKDLKGILTQLGISKQGKKQDLVERIITVLSDEQASKIWTKKKTAGRDEIAKLVDDTYRKMQGCGANYVACKGQDTSDGGNLKISDEVNDPSHFDRKVRCPCGCSLATDSLIKCEDRKCHIWQHIRCVIISEKTMEVTPPVPDSFYCELCRLSRADPFCVTVSHLLYPVKSTVTNVPTDGSNPMQSIERTFQITRADKDLLLKPECDVQAWCMLLNDKVQFRMHWPQYTDLQVNGLPIRATNRPGQQLLGANGRDDGPIITPCTKEGINKISLTGCDARIFCLGVRIVKRRTLQQVLKLIPKEAEGERFEDALIRVCRCVGGGNEVDNADSDSDIEVVAEFVTVNLRCPMSGLRMKIAGRFKPCAHMGCFDLEVFVELNQRSRKWQCPICLKNYSLENIIIDPYFNRITSKMKDCSEDVTELEVKSDGSWRIKCKAESERRELQDLVEWHLPDGTLSSPLSEINQTVQTSMQIKQEDFSEGCVGSRFGMKKNSCGLWEFGRLEDVKTPSSGNNLQDDLGFHGQNVIPMSSSATGSGRDDDPSVNHDGGGTFDLVNTVVELGSTCLNIDSPFGFSDRNQCTPAGNTDVIVLTDSDEENEILICPGPDYNKNQTDGRMIIPLPSTSIADSFQDDPTLVNGGVTVTSSLDLYNSNDEDFGMHLWQSPTGNHGGQGLQLFSTDADVSALVDLQHNSVNSVPSINSYLSGPGTSMVSANLVQDSLGQPNANIHDGYAVYPFPFDGDDPSLQIFLPTRPSDELAASNTRDQSNMSNGLSSDDWISLRLGDGASSSHNMTSTANGLGAPQPMQMTSGNGLYPSEQMPSDGFNISGHIPSNVCNQSEHIHSDGLNTIQQMPSVEAALLPGPNDSGAEKVSRQRSDSPFSFPRQKRSVRPRLHLSIDSGSE